MGKDSGGSQVVGYSYFLDFAYTYCEQIDSLEKIYRDGKQTWPIDGSSNIGVPASVECRTGTTAPVAGSEELGESSTINIYGGNQASILEMVEWTGLDIGYQNTCTLAFPQVFIGDNVQSISKFEIQCKNNSFQGISSYKTLPSGNANPIDVIYNILMVDLQMDTAMIDTASFQAAAYTVYTEGIGVGLVLSTTRKVMDWINDQLSIVDGVIFIDAVTNLLTIKLLRDDYVIGDLIELTDDNTSAVTFESVSWAQTYNKFVFKFANLATAKEISIELTNTAARVALGYDRTKTISYPSINDGAVMNIVATRTINKLGVPLAALKASVDYIDYPNINVGDAIKFNSTSLNINKVFRVVKISGDNEEATTINVECVEDFFAKTHSIAVPDPDEGIEYTPPNYSLTAPAHYAAKDAKRESTANDGIVFMATAGSPDEFVLGVNCSQVGGLTNSCSPMTYCTLNTAIIEDITGEGASLVNSKEYNQSYTFRVNDVDGNLFEYFGSENTLQNLRHVAYIGDEEVSFKSITDLGGNVFEIEGIMRGLNDTAIVTHAIGTPMFISSTEGRFTSTLSTNTAAVALRFYTHNHINVSPQVPLNITYGYTISKPYNPAPYQTVWGATKTFSWRPRVALHGANYRSAESVVGGVDEGKVTGYYHITYPNGSTSTITPVQGDLIIEQDTTQTGIHYVKHINSDTQRYDTAIAVNIT